MPAIEETVHAIIDAPDWAKRIQLIRHIPEHHGTADQIDVYASVARTLYLPHLSPDFAYIHDAPFFAEEHFFEAYAAASDLTQLFTQVKANQLVSALLKRPFVLLVFRTLLGLTQGEFSQATKLVASAGDLAQLSASQINTWERDAADHGDPPTSGPRFKFAEVAAATTVKIMDRSLFDAPAPGLRIKQDKADTANGWASVRAFATNGVPLRTFLHQRHYGGAYRQLLDATSGRRGDLIEDAVEALFTAGSLSFVRTGSHNQAEVARRFGVTIAPAPDFVVFDASDDALQAILECKGTNDGGTARDKALRFSRLRSEAIRLGGVPLFAVLGGTGWARIRDALAPVIRDTDGRVFTSSTLNSMLEVPPFSSLRSRLSG